MSDLHVVYRVDDPGLESETWSSYSFPHSIYVEGSALVEVRSEVQQAIQSIPSLHDCRILEHLERPIPPVPGAYIRVAIDRRTLDRDVARDQFVSSLLVRSQREDFVRTVPTAATGDVVAIACVADDRLGWVFDQMTDYDSIAICLAGPATEHGALTTWNYLVGRRSDRFGTSGNTETLADAGLVADSSIADFMRIASAADGRGLLLSSA
jgi:hypothetical protein